jgi:biopolymer transport protein ExbD
MSLWRIRPADSSGNGKSVAFDQLTEAIGDDLVGDLDEVQGPGESGWTPVGEHPQTAPYVLSQRRVSVRDPEDAEADMTPMIDVTLQLVIFFMIAATYTIQKTLDLPAAKPAEDTAGAVTMEELEQNNILVLVAADGTVRIDDQEVPLDNLIDGLESAMRQDRTAELVLDVDDQAVHDVVVKVLDAAGAAQIEKVLFVSRVEPSAAAAFP